MKLRLIIALLLIANISFAQSWTPINGKQRFNAGLGLPVKDSSYFTGDTSLIYIGLDSNLYFKRRSYNNLIITKTYSNSRYLDSVSKVSNFRYRFYKNGLTFYDQVFDTSSLGFATNYNVSASTYKVDTVSNITTLQSYSGTSRSIFVTDTLRGGYFNLVYNTTVYNDGGVYFAATGIGSNYHWRRNTTQNDYVNIQWWGAVPDVDYSNRQGTDNTAAIQAALNYSANLKAKKIVFIPAGAYMSGRIMIPDGVQLLGVDGHENYSTSLIGSAIFSKPNLNTNLICFGYHLAAGRKLVEGSIKGIALWGDWANSTTGYAISFRDTLNNIVCPQDLFNIDNMVIRGFPSGGIELPDANESVKLINNVKFIFNRGYGIDFTQPAVRHAQLTTITDVAAYGNTLGTIRLKGLDISEVVNIVNLKNEEAVNTAYSADSIAGQNAIVLEDCDDATIQVSGMTHVSTITKGNGYLRKAGNAIQIKGTVYPRLSWSASVLRVIGTEDPADTDPYMAYVENTGEGIDYRINATTLGSQNYTTDTLVSVTVAGSKARSIIGTGYKWTYPTSDNEQGIKVVNTTPYIGISETDQSAGFSDYGLRNYFGDGALVGISSDSKFQQFFRMRKQTSGLPYSSAVTRALQLTDSVAANSSIPSLTQNSTNPTINSSSFFATQNTSATSISSFATGAAGMLLYVQANDNNTTFVHKSSSSADNIDMGGYNIKADSGQIYLFIRNQNYWKYLGASNLLTNTVNTFTKPQNFGSGAVSSTAYGLINIPAGVTFTPTAMTNGSGIHAASLTITDNVTAASGSVGTVPTHYLQATTYNATNTSVTYSNASTLYISGAPIAGTNLTFSNSWGLYVNALSRFTGVISTANSLFGGTTFMSNTNAKIQISGSITGANTTTKGVHLASGLNSYTDNTTAASGTATWAVANSFDGQVFAATNTGVTYTNAATVYITQAPSAGTNATITNPWALYVAAGSTRLSTTSINVGSDATGDLLYRSSTGLLARLGIGSTGSFLTVSGGLPAWSSSTLTLGGNLTTSGAFATTLTTTATTALTLPSSGTVLAANTPSALTAGATITLTPSPIASSFTLNVGANATSTLNMGTIPSSVVGSDIDVSITSTTTSCVITFGTSFKSQGTLTTGATSGKIFHIKFHVVSTSQVDEVSRTIAM